jgi:serine/threonine-protein kinase
MVMEYLDGGDLANWLEKRGAMPVEQATEFLLQACEAIAEAHALGIVHRDLKPANLFVVKRPDGGLSVKVLDFGISKRTGLGASGASMTRTTAVMGSPLYMSPEQMQSSKDTDPRSDIWALGIILYELITGDAPFVADTMPELVLKIVSAPPPLLRTKRPDAPLALEQIILKCVEKDRSKRYQNVAELAAALVDYAPRRARVSLERIAGVMKSAGITTGDLHMPAESIRAEAPPAGSGTINAWGQTAAGAGRGRGALVVGGIALVLVLFGIGIGGYLLRGNGGAPSAESAAAPPPARDVPKPAPAPPETAAAPKAEPAPLPSPQTVVTPVPSVEPAPAVAPPGQPAVAPGARPHVARAGKATAHSPTTPVAGGQPAAPAPAAPPPAAAAKPNVYDDRK